METSHTELSGIFEQEKLGNIDRGRLEAFADEIEELGRKLASEVSYSDYLHLRKIEKRGRFSTFIGLATAWILPNPISAFLISFGNLTRWGLVHHILHGGYDKVPGIPQKYTSSHFARGWRRFVDWFDWMIPEAWEYEHNVLHHYHTGEDDDPDLVERYIEFLRKARIPVFLKYLYVLLSSVTWKFTYYAPNTVSVIDPSRLKRLNKKHIAYVTILNIVDLSNPHIRKLWTHCYFPYALFKFALIPACFAPLGGNAVYYVLLNMIFAELLTNLHSFMIISPNHSGEDLCRYDFHFADKKEFYLTQVLGSANYNCGDDITDHLQIWLNYQIEHHLFPKLPMTAYQKAQPRVKAICEKYGIPYVQESVFLRVKKMVDICVGKGSMINIQNAEDLKKQGLVS